MGILDCGLAWLIQSVGALVAETSPHTVQQKAVVRLCGNYRRLMTNTTPKISHNLVTFLELKTYSIIQSKDISS